MGGTVWGLGGCRRRDEKRLTTWKIGPLTEPGVEGGVG